MELNELVNTFYVILQSTRKTNGKTERSDSMMGELENLFPSTMGGSRGPGAMTPTRQYFL